MQEFIDGMKGRYQRKGLIKSTVERDPWPPFQAKSYTNLALIHQNRRFLPGKKSTKKATNLRAKGAIEKIPKLTASIKLNNICQIFDPLTSDDQQKCPMSILIEGHPGIGKTTLAKEICLQWANDQLLASDKLVLLLMLRDPNIQKVTSVKELVKYFTQSGSQTQSTLRYLQSANGTGVTFIIDGFDELSTELRETSFFRNLIEGDILPNARVVVTSRPSASACLQDVVHRRIEILGFEKSSKEQYANDALKDSPSDLTKLKQHFIKYPNIDAICYIPLNMAIIVFLCLVGYLPPTSTEMYESFILHTVCRHLKRTGKISKTKVVNKFEHFPKQVQKGLKEIEEVAIQGLLEDKIVFTISDLPEICKVDPTCYGLLQSTECYSANEIGSSTLSFNFLHLGIQEYFAAKCVANLPSRRVCSLLKASFLVKYTDEYVDSDDLCSDDNDDGASTDKDLDLDDNASYASIGSRGSSETKCVSKPEDDLNANNFSDHSDSSESFGPPDSDSEDEESQYAVRLSNMWILYCGITGGKSTPLRQHLIATPTHLQIYPPASKVSSHTQEAELKQSENVEPDSEKTKSEIISQYIMDDPIKVLYLFQCFQEAQNDELCEILSNSFSNKLDLCAHKLLPYQVVSLGYFLSKSHIKWQELCLPMCDIGDHGITLLHQYLCGGEANKKEIEILDLSGNYLTAISSPFIADLIAYLQPHTLILSDNKLSYLGDVSAAINNTPRIKNVSIQGNYLKAEEATGLSSMIGSLEELYIDCNKLHDDGMEKLSDSIAMTTTLKVFSISNNKLELPGNTALSYALMKNTSLQTLTMTVCQGISAPVSSVITTNNQLEELTLENDDSHRMDETSALAILKSLYNNSTITKITLPKSLTNQDCLNKEVEDINTARKRCDILPLNIYYK